MNKLATLVFAATAAMAGSASAQSAPPYAPLTTDIKAPTPYSAYVQDARGVIARDPFGEEILKVLRGEGVDVSAVVRVDGEPTGLMIKELRTPTEVHVHYWRRGSAAAGLGPEDVDDRLLASASRVHLTGITLALGERPRAAVHKVLRRCAELRVPVSFDPNLRRKLRPVAESVADHRELVGHRRGSC